MPERAARLNWSEYDAHARSLVIDSLRTMRANALAVAMGSEDRIRAAYPSDSAGSVRQKLMEIAFSAQDIIDSALERLGEKVD